MAHRNPIFIIFVHLDKGRGAENKTRKANVNRAHDYETSKKMVKAKVA